MTKNKANKLKKILKRLKMKEKKLCFLMLSGSIKKTLNLIMETKPLNSTPVFLQLRLRLGSPKENENLLASITLMNLYIR